MENKDKNPKKVIAALRGEITKKNKEIERLKDVIIEKTIEIQEKERIIRSYDHKCLIKRFFSKKYLDNNK